MNLSYIKGDKRQSEYTVLALILAMFVGKSESVWLEWLTFQYIVQYRHPCWALRDRVTVIFCVSENKL